MANPKTILHAKNAPKKIAENVIRADNLVAYIQKLNQQSKAKGVSMDALKRKAESFLLMHQEKKTRYLAKYHPYLTVEEAEKLSRKRHRKRRRRKRLDPNVQETQLEVREPVSKAESIEASPLFQTLREYRTKKSKELQMKPFYIFTNRELEDILRKRPSSLEELRAISGIGDYKVTHFGQDILKIIANNQAQ